MNSLAVRIPDVSKRIPTLAFLFGVVLLLGTWVVLYWAESLFTESHLVGYYCCVSEQDLPAMGTLERTVSDVFRTSPGKHLPSLLLVSVSASIFTTRMRKTHGKVWLPFFFALFNILYLVVDFWLAGVSWSISDWMVGPLTSAYKGYHRTWYGIVSHLLLWGVFFFAIAWGSLVATTRTKTQIDTGSRKENCY
jgi:hypothetical protein